MSERAADGHGKAAADMGVEFGVLGAVTAWDGDGRPLALRGPRHRAVLARLIVARRRVVPVARLVADLWDEPPSDAVGAVRTFVSALRRSLEPGRPPRAPARLLVTEGPGYALRAGVDEVDAWWFEQVTRDVEDAPPGLVAARLGEALERWRGPAYADFGDSAWARPDRSRLTDLRLHAVERYAEARVTLGAAAEVAAELDAHVAEHPWREEGWRLLALALYRAGRQADALSVSRRARTMLREELGVDPGPRLRRLEEDVLRQADHLGPGGDTTDRVWAEATAAYERAVAPRAGTRLESTAGLMRDLAVTGGGGLESARRHRVAAVAAAERLGDPELTARVIGVYDVPAVWTRSDDPEQARWLVGVADRTLRQLPATGHEAARCRLLATVAVESRGTPPPGADPAGTGARARRAARQAEQLARGLDDAALLAYALNGTYLQTFTRTGLAARRDAIGAEVLDLAERNGLARYAVLGHLVRVQALCALADLAGADRHAGAADELALRHELPLVGVLTGWYRALRTAVREPPEAAQAAYRRAAEPLKDAGMPGVREGLLPLALLSVDVLHGRPVVADSDACWGPYEPWVRPLLLASEGRTDTAREALREVAAPPGDLLTEVLWSLLGRAALLVGDRATARRAVESLRPAAAEHAAGSGMITLGPVGQQLRDLEALADGR